MPPEKTEGITPERLDRLWKHLLKLEELTGGKLRLTSRKDDARCPITNFAPDVNSSNAFFVRALLSGRVHYSFQLGGNKYYKIYECEDSNWWLELLFEKRREVTKWVEERLKERKRCQLKE